jgi:hypothetical protein
MQAIRVRYLPATEKQGARLKATHSGGTMSLTVGRGHSYVSPEEQAREVAEALKSSLGWTGALCQGSYGNDWYFVPCERGEK